MRKKFQRPEKHIQPRERIEFGVHPFPAKTWRAQQFYAKVPIEFGGLGSYHNMGIFFDKVSKLHRIINVVDFNMTRAKDTKGKSELWNLGEDILYDQYLPIYRKERGKESEKKKIPEETAAQDTSKPKKK